MKAILFAFDGRVETAQEGHMSSDDSRPEALKRLTLLPEFFYPVGIRLCTEVLRRNPVEPNRVATGVAVGAFKTTKARRTGNRSQRRRRDGTATV